MIFVLDFRPWMLTSVQMKGHVLHFSWLQGVLPDVLVAGCRSFDRTNMSRKLVSRLYAISGGRLKILATSIRTCRRLQFDRMILRTQVVEQWKRRLMIGLYSAAVLLLGCSVFCRGMGLTWSRAFLTVFCVSSLKKEVGHFLSFFFEVCIV